MAKAGATAPSRDLAAQRFGRLLVITWVPTHGRNAHWLCQCDCGARTIVAGDRLQTGGTQSCGCLRSEPWAYKHGMKGSRLYGVWSGMKKRCGNVNAANFHSYGGRGIFVCPEWAESFPAFKDWALSHGYDDRLFIDRIDNDGPYSPTNCRFVDRTTNNRNRRITRFLDLGGERLAMADAAKRYGIKYDTLKMRLALGYSDEQAVQATVSPNEKAGVPTPRVVAQQLRASAARRARSVRREESKAS